MLTGTGKLIPLTRGNVALVDAGDYRWLRQWQWSYLSSGYACRGEKNSGKQHMVLMHRALLNAPDGSYIDHINGNRLDNRRCNLRIVTPQQSAYNTRKRKSATGFRGVTKHPDPKRSRPYQARIRAEGKHLRLGWFETPEDAARAYDEAAIRLHGEYAVLNFGR